MRNRAPLAATLGALLVTTGCSAGAKNHDAPALQLVVTMTQDSQQTDRQALKDACGTVPGVSVVMDASTDPSIRGRLPVRFNISSATDSQERALMACITEHNSKVRGSIREG
ncbi:MAG: hypothetical protein JWP14_2671 [Frankiales bacterium]|nr:hypothetical protein [Frankiales bacterium]